MRQDQTGSFATKLCASSALALVTAWAGAAAAQQAPASAPAGADNQVVVTGSRIIQNGFQAPTPVSVVSVQSLEQFAAPSIPEALRELPSLIKTTGPTAAPGATGSDPSASVGTFLNLRNLGTVRNLLMEDGMRVPPTRADGQTDANVIPQMLVSRVEVVTGGASAAYGSDAVSGVINYIMDNRFTGIKGLIQGGELQRHDMGSYRIGLAVGGSFLDGKLHVVASGERRDNSGIPSSCDRPYICDAYSFGGLNGGAAGGLSAANPYVIYKNAFLAKLPYTGLIETVYNVNPTTGALTANTAANTALANLVFSADGKTLRPYNAGTLIASATCLACDGSAWGPKVTTLVPRQTDSQVYSHVEYEVTPHFTLFGQASYAQDETYEQQGNTSWFGNTGLTTDIWSGNAYLPASVQSTLTATGASYLVYDSSRDQVNGDIKGAIYHGLNKNLNYNFGAKGDFGKGWNWKAYFQNSESTQRTSGHVVDDVKLAAALDAVKDPSGNIVCRVTLTNPGAYPGCTPLNLLGINQMSQAAKDYIDAVYVTNQTTTLQGGGADITGHPFSTWAGEVGVAVGGEWRRQALKVTSTQGTPIIPNTIRFGNMSQLPYRAINIVPITGSYTVGEVFGEANIPLLKDFSVGGLSLARSLSLDAAVRFTNYSISGSVVSWKFGGNWQVNDDLRIRVTRSRDVRAPTLNDFFAPQSTTLTAFTDIHTGNTFSSVTTLSQGNINLKPELADTWTVGGVLSPSFLPGFTASVDWYDIGIGNAIQTFGAAALVTACEASGGTSSLCDGVKRPLPFSNTTALNYPTVVYAQSYNAVQLIAKGLDVELSYRHDLMGGQLNLHGLATYQYEYDSQSSPVNPLLNGAGYGAQPKLIMTGSVGYKKGPFGINLQERRIGGWSQAAVPGTTGAISYYQNPVIGAVYYTDLGVTYDFKVANSKRMQAFFNVTNLFDTLPPLIPSVNNPSIGYPTNRTLYDVVLRNFSAGIRFQF